MIKYRFKTKEEFIADNEWNHKDSTPKSWNCKGEMNKYLGKVIEAVHNKDIESTTSSFNIDGWAFSLLDYLSINIEVNKVPKYVKCINDGYSYHTHPYATTLSVKNYSGKFTTNQHIYIVDKVCKVNDLNAYALTRDGKGYLLEVHGAVEATKADYDSQFETLLEFPFEGYCKCIDNDLLNHLSNVLEKEFTSFKPPYPIALCWNKHSYWYVSGSSSKPLYNIEHLRPFFTNSDELIDGEWYYLPKSDGFYAKYSKKLTEKGQYNKTENKSCSEWINNIGIYHSNQGVANFKNATIALYSVQEYLPNGHKDKLTTDQSDQKQQSLKTNKNEKTSRKPSNSEKSNYGDRISISIKICKPNLTLSTGISIRGIGLKGSGSKIKLGNHHSYN